ncbi:hypothetical protein BC826DRAFT_1048299 [Russula brevipes]|nr:hypothetical protein BC826DRAFT_1048299 [Russula brevipes]
MISADVPLSLPSSCVCSLGHDKQSAWVVPHVGRASVGWGGYTILRTEWSSGALQSRYRVGLGAGVGPRWWIVDVSPPKTRMTFFDLTCSGHVITLPRARSGDGCVGGVLSLQGSARWQLARSEEEDKRFVSAAVLEARSLVVLRLCQKCWVYMYSCFGRASAGWLTAATRLP